MNRFSLLSGFILSLLFSDLSGQVDFRMPMDIPMYLSGNFGELRTSHFHTGLDIKTGGVTGVPIYAIQSGYVSRIKVSPYGYGKALYVDHESGYTSVYAHLEAYTEEITRFLRNAQYELESFSVDLIPGRDQIKVEKGDLIGWSGNSGSSGGPHLHFEIRETDTERPVNPLSLGIDVIDEVKPILKTIKLYPVGEDSWVEGLTSPREFPLAVTQGKGSLKQRTPIKIGGKVGLAFNAHDQLSGTSNYCGIFKAELYANEELIFEFSFEKLDFAQRRMIHGHRDYASFQGSRTSFQRTHRLPNNPLIIYGNSVRDGFLEFSEPGIHRVKLLVYDYSGNQSSVEFEVKLEAERPKINQSLLSADKSAMRKEMFRFDEDNQFKSTEVLVNLPAGHLFEDSAFEYEELDALPGALTKLYRIGNAATPLYKPLSLELEFNSGSISADQLVLVRINKGKKSVQSSQYKNGKLSADLDQFGLYTVFADSTPPVIRPYDFKKIMPGTKGFSFRVADDLSGIESCNAWIDGKWVLSDFDAKRADLSCSFDENYMTRGEHKLVIEVVDGCGNIGVYSSEFRW